MQILKSICIRTLLVFSFTVLALQSASAAPPYSGTVFNDPDIITSSDPTTYTGKTYTGQGNRLMYDRRTDSFSMVNAHLFDATFSDGLTAEIQVNPEFDVSTATALAETYGTEIGRIPTILRTDVATVWIHDGDFAFGGGNNNLLIHTTRGDSYIATNFLEEVFIHEAVHTSLDATHAASAGWLAAQSADPDFISTYAESNPTTEDVAESFLLYLAVTYRVDQIPQAMSDTIRATIPNRIAYFDSQNFDLSPITGPTDVVYVDFDFAGTETGALDNPWNTLQEALDVVDPGGVINIKGNTGDSNSPETFTAGQVINQDVTINALNGAVTIGNPAARSTEDSSKTGFVTRKQD